MSSAKVDVEVYDGARRVERLTQRPVRLMPDKRAGVVYAGDVFPLRHGDRIDLADTPTEKTLCTRFVAPSAPIPYAPGRPTRTASKAREPDVRRWYVESNRFGHYLVFDASATTAKRVVALVEEVGLGVRRWDESVREADNGESYDWFIRLGFEGTREECLRRVNDAIGSTRTANSPPPPVATSADADIRALRAEILALQVTNLELQTGSLLQQVTADNEIKRLRAELEGAERAATQAQKQHTTYRGRTKTERAQLRGQVVHLEAQLAAAQQRPSVDPDTEGQLRAVREAKSEAELLYFEAQSAAEEWEELARATERELTSLRSQLHSAQLAAEGDQERRERAESELVELRDESRERRSAARSAGGPPQGSVEAFLARLLPRTVLDADTVETLLDWPSPAAAIDFLRQVDSRTEPRGRKSVVNKTAWWEIPKVNTGRTGKESAGRIYYAATKDQRVLAVLHEKQDDKEQKRFIAQLPDLP